MFEQKYVIIKIEFIAGYVRLTLKSLRMFEEEKIEEHLDEVSPSLMRGGETEFPTLILEPLKRLVKASAPPKETSFVLLQVEEDEYRQIGSPPLLASITLKLEAQE